MECKVVEDGAESVLGGEAGQVSRGQVMKGLYVTLPRLDLMVWMLGSH